MGAGLIGLCLMLSAEVVQAMTVREYEAQRDSADVTAFKFTKVYVSGLAIGYVWANSTRVGEHLSAWFCLPADIKGDTDFTPLLDDEIGQSYVTRDDPIELLLFSALARKYPCPAAAPKTP